MRQRIELPEFKILDHIDRLTVVKELPTEYHCQCPVCDDGGFKIDRETGKYSAFKCGCSTEQIREAIRPLKDALAEYSDRFVKVPKPKASKPTYFEYPDTDNNPLARVARLETGSGKEFWQEYWNGKAWVKGLPSEIRSKIHLYRINDWVNQQAIGKDGPLYLVEGEANVDKLLSLGIGATTAIAGAGKWKDYGYSNYRVDLHPFHYVVLCPDRDLAGIDHTKKVAEDIPDASWLYADPNYPVWQPNHPTWAEKKGDGFDLGDWIDQLQSQGKDAEAIANLLAESTISAAENAKLLQKWESKQPDKKPSLDRGEGNKDELCSLAKGYHRLNGLIGDRLRFNSLTKDVELDGEPQTIEQLELHLALKHNSQFRQLDLIARAIAEEKKYSPVVEYLDSVYSKHGDNTGILESLAKRYFGRSEAIYTTFVVKWLVSAVARAYTPGCKVDTALILQGAQGSGKSSFFKILASDDWFDDSLGSVNDKDERLKLHRAWVLEWAELESIFKRKDIATTKAFLSCSIDNLRPPYGRSVEQMKRHSVIVGTTNQDEFLTDSTGNRRFWVVPVRTPIDLELLRTERDRIWAAAVSLYRSGVDWWLNSEESKQAAAIAEDYQFRDPWLDPIQAWIDGNFKTQATTTEILDRCLQIELARQDKSAQMRVADCLKQMGWSSPSGARVHNGKRQRVWVAPLEVEASTQPTQPSLGVVSEVIPSETIANKGFERDRHNLHNLDHQKPSEIVQSDLPSNSSVNVLGDRAQSDKSFGPKGCVGCVDAEKPSAVKVSRRTTCVQPLNQGCVDQKGCVDQNPSNSPPLKQGDRVQTPKGQGIVKSLEDDNVRVEGENFYAWFQLKQVTFLA